MRKVARKAASRPPGRPDGLALGEAATPEAGQSCTLWYCFPSGAATRSARARRLDLTRQPLNALERGQKPPCGTIAFACDCICEREAHNHSRATPATPSCPTPHRKSGISAPVPPFPNSGFSATPLAHGAGVPPTCRACTASSSQAIPQSRLCPCSASSRSTPARWCCW